MALHRGQWRGYQDVGPAVKQYGHFESVDEEQIDPRILEAERLEAERRQRSLESTCSQGRMCRRWTPEGIVHEAPSSKVGDKPPRLEGGELDMSKDFPDPPPKPAVGLAGSWSAPSPGWPSAQSPYGPPPAYGAASPYGPPPVPPRPAGPSFGGAR